ncbi:TetR/AcrR family transcriptional regulator [Paenibacillus kobensis]|uniref:TetR/AcrR family transcriptional regulator n=1 Tax=Paenibacillus kobensis TaxID=59841 RepID=UPI000FD991DE|nr:TetR/AcrR family transcriptional regulator [Paenibacillus kobensis]
MSAPNRRVNKTKRELKDALVQLMESKDFKQISITDIVTLADLNRGTFYKHYQTKEELLGELMNDVIEDLVRAYNEPYLHTDKLVVSELTTSSIIIFKHVDLYADFYRIIINSNALPGFQNRICDSLKQLVKRVQLINEPSSRTIDPDLFASYIAYSLFGLIVEWVRGGFKFTPEHMAAQLLAILSYPYAAGVSPVRS